MEEIKDVQSITHNFSPSFIRSIRMDRISKIFFNMSIVAISLLFMSALSTIFVPIAQLFLIIVMFIVIVCAIIFTFGTIFVVPNSPIGKMWDFLIDLTNFDSMENIVNYVINAIPYICFAGILLSTVSLLLNVCNKSKRSAGKIVSLSIFISLFAIGIVLFFVLGGSL